MMSLSSVGESLHAAAPARSVPVTAPGVPPRREPVAPRRAPGARPPLRLVEPSSRRRLRVGLVSTVCLTAVFLTLFGLAAMHSMVVQAQFELDRLDQQVSQRQSEIEARQLEVARLESPAAVVGAARDLGMVEPSEPVYLLPEPGTARPGGDGDAEVAGGRTDDDGPIEQADGTPTIP